VRMMQQRRVRYIGLDVHRATVAVAIAEEQGSPSSYGTIANDPAAVRKLMLRLGGKDVELRAHSARGLQKDFSEEKQTFFIDLLGTGALSNRRWNMFVWARKGRASGRTTLARLFRTRVNMELL
jgi:hypothetical protein